MTATNKFYAVDDRVKLLTTSGFREGTIVETRIVKEQYTYCFVKFDEFKFVVPVISNSPNFAHVRDSSEDFLFNFFVSEPACPYKAACKPGSGCCTRVSRR